MERGGSCERLIDLLSMHHDPVFTVVCTGGKRYHHIFCTHRYACVKERRGLKGIQEIRIDIIGLITYRVADIGYGCFMAGENLITMCAVFQIDVYIGVFLPEIFFQIVLQVSEHSTAAHIVSIDDCMQIGQIVLVAALDENTACSILFLLCL